MAEIARIPLPLVNYPSGTQTLGPVNVPSRIHGARLELARCTSATPTIWPSASTLLGIEVQIEVAGQWRQLAAASGARGGILLDRQGLEAAMDYFEVRRPDEITVSRARAIITITGGPLRTQGALILLGP